MSYTAMYRKFRPGKFEDVKGQDHIVKTLKNQIKSDRIGHAYLFCGTRGTGKTSVAKLFAKSVNCQNLNGEDPCCECPSCMAIQSGASMNVIEIDAASNNGVDNIRQIVEEVQYPPQEGRFKVYIIDEVHMLSIGAFNALLKTLEEPPSYVIFILATTEVHKLPITILSRCQRYDFKRIGVDNISGRIRELLTVEGLEADDEAIRYIAKMADGAMRDALSLLDQCLAFNFGQTLTYDMVLDVLGAVDNDTYSALLKTITDSDVAGAIKILEDAIMEGRDLTQFITDFTWYLRNLLLAKVSNDDSVIADMSGEALNRLREEAKVIEAEKAIRYIRVFSELTNQIRYSTNKRIMVEIALIKLCCPQMESTEDSIIPRIRDIEDKLENGISVVAQIPAAQAASQEVIKPAELPKSVPEDIQEIVKNWYRIQGMMSPANAAFLKNAIPSLGQNGELMLVFSNEQCKEHFETNNENTLEHAQMNLQEVKDAIASASGKSVEILIVLAKDEVHQKSDYANLLSMFNGIEVVEETED